MHTQTYVFPDSSVHIDLPAVQPKAKCCHVSLHFHLINEMLKLHDHQSYYCHHSYHILPICSRILLEKMSCLPACAPVRIVAQLLSDILCLRPADVNLQYLRKHGKDLKLVLNSTCIMWRILFCRFAFWSVTNRRNAEKIGSGLSRTMDFKMKWTQIDKARQVQLKESVE